LAGAKPAVRCCLEIRQLAEPAADLRGAQPVDGRAQRVTDGQAQQAAAKLIDQFLEANIT